MATLTQQLFILFIFSAIDFLVILETVETVSSSLINDEETFVPPCPEGTVPYDNEEPKIINGCGSL
jgi:hypothetical protein